MDEETGLCPLCGAGPGRRVVQGAGWEIRACCACTNAWTEPPPGTVDYAASNFHAFAVAGGEPTRRRTVADLPEQWRESLLMQASLLERNLVPGARVLEIGCGEGLLLGELVRRGFRVAGVEASASASAAARAAGLNVVTGYFPHPAVTGPFDAVVMSHVLEHLARPRAILEQVGRLAPRGKFLLVQSHWRGWMPRWYKERWYAWLPEQHFWHFTPRGVEALLRPLGWAVRVVEYSSLVHEKNKFSRLALRVAGLGDQFHLLADVA